jgi:hypothetical protein
MSHLRLNNPSGDETGVLFDQELAYYIVHSGHLKSIMLEMGFPIIMMQRRIDLFFSTQVNISMNRYLAAPILQKRSLRQGDPLSPILFSIAFELLLKKLLQAPN